MLGSRHHTFAFADLLCGHMHGLWRIALRHPACSPFNISECGNPNFGDSFLHCFLFRFGVNIGIHCVVVLSLGGIYFHGITTHLVTFSKCFRTASPLVRYTQCIWGIQLQHCIVFHLVWLAITLDISKRTVH